MSMRASPEFANDVRSRTNYHDLDDMQPTNLTFSPLDSRSNNQPYQIQGPRNPNKYQTPKPQPFAFFSRRCLIGLGIGLAIGVAIVLVIALPVGLVKTCGVGYTSSTPNWIGTYQMDNGCDTTTCCCLSGQVQFYQIATNQLQITGGVTGICNGFQTSFSASGLIPTTFTSVITWYGETIRITLGPDNSYLSFVNLNFAYCSATAVRTSYSAASMKDMNLALIMFILPITIAIMKS